MSKNQSLFRLSRESEKAFEYFKYFLSLPPSERSSRAVAAKYLVSEANIKKIRRRWNWNERTLDYDNHLALAATRGIMKAVEKAEFDWAIWEIANLEKTRKITDELLAKVEKILNLEVIESETLEKQIFDNKTGKPILDFKGNPIYQLVTINKPVKFKASDAVRFLESAVVLTQYLVKHQGLLLTKANPDYYIPEQSKPLDEMTKDELDEYIQKLRRAKEAMMKG